MRLTHSALTSDVLVKFEVLVNRHEFSEQEKESFEHLAFCACMGGRSYSEQWERFTDLVKREHAIDLNAMHNETADVLLDYVRSAIPVYIVPDDFDWDKVEHSVYLDVFCYGNDITAAIRGSVKTFREISKMFAERDRRMAEQNAND